MWWMQVPDKVLEKRKCIPLAPSSLSCCLRCGCGSEPLQTTELRDEETTANALDSYLREIKFLFNLRSFYFGSSSHLAINATYPNKFGTKDCVVETSLENSKTTGPWRTSGPFHGWQLLGENIFCHHLGILIMS